jgi:hypothetical protein
VPRDMPAEQGRCSVGDTIERGVRVGAACPSLYLPRGPQIDDDETKIPVSIVDVLLERDIDPSNKRVVAGDAGKKTVLCVSLKLVRDGDILARQHDAHAHRSGKFLATVLRGELVLLHLAP